VKKTKHTDVPMKNRSTSGRYNSKEDKNQTEAPGEALIPAIASRLHLRNR